MEAGVYKITNSINGKFYIGSTSRLSARKAEHKYKLKSNKGNSAIRSAVLKYGEKNFIFEVLENFHFGDWATKEYINEILETREQYYIDTFQPKYNIRLFDVTRSTYVCSEQQKEHLRRIAKLPKNKALYNRPVILMDSDGNEIKEYRCAKDAQKDLNLYSGSVYRVLSGEYKHTSNHYFKLK